MQSKIHFPCDKLVALVFFVFLALGMSTARAQEQRSSTQPSDSRDHSMKRFAIIADMHITDTPASPKYMAMEWCVERIKELNPDAIISLGDLTATGKMDQAEYVLKLLESTGIPLYSTPGNAEYRNNLQECVQAFTIQSEDKDLLLVDSANYTLSPEDRKAISELPDGARILLGTHVHYLKWLEEDQEILAEAVKRGAIGTIIAGHSHVDGEELLRGCDPDKASGGVPAFEIWTKMEDGHWLRSREEMPGVDPQEWSQEERQRFLGSLGISCMYESTKNIRLATELGIQTLELRADAVWEEPIEPLKQALAEWRKVASGPLSLHLPNLTPREDQEKLIRGVATAIELGCDRVTLHVPAVTAEAFPTERKVLEENFLRCITPLLERGIYVGIENLHTRPVADPSQESPRNYGCNIEECRSWILALRDLTRSNRIGFHLDIGHARNNSPFSGEEYLSDYYKQMGMLINGFHLHQVKENPDKSMTNHCKLDDCYGQLISLSGLFIAYRKGLFSPDAPMYLEISEPDGGIESWKSLRGYFINQTKETK